MRPRAPRGPGSGRPLERGSKADIPSEREEARSRAAARQPRRSESVADLLCVHAKKTKLNSRPESATLPPGCLCAVRCVACLLRCVLCGSAPRLESRDAAYLGWSAATRQCSGRDQRSVSLAHSPMLRLSGSTSMVMPWLRVGSFWMARSVSQFAFASGWVPSSTRAKTVWS